MNKETQEFLDANDFKQSPFEKIRVLDIEGTGKEVSIVHHNDHYGYTGFILVFCEQDEDSPERFLNIGNDIARVMCLYFGLTGRILKRKMSTNPIEENKGPY